LCIATLQRFDPGPAFTCHNCSEGKPGIHRDPSAELEAKEKLKQQIVDAKMFGVELFGSTIAVAVVALAGAESKRQQRIAKAYWRAKWATADLTASRLLRGSSAPVTFERVLLRGASNGSELRSEEMLRATNG